MGIKKMAICLTLVLFVFVVVVFGQYNMERNVFATGTPGKSGGSYIMREGALAQTAATTIGSAGDTLQQGYIHRPFLFIVDYDIVDIADPDPIIDPHFSPATNTWHEPDGALDICADNVITDGTTRYYFVQWTGGTFADATSNCTTLEFFQSQSIIAEYKTQYQVTFAANTSNDTATGYDWDPILYPNMKLLDATDYVEVDYTDQGTPATASNIYDGNSQTVWVDRNTPWTYSDDNASYTPGDQIRWFSTDPFKTGTFDETHAGNTITCCYYQQFLCAVDLVYAPDDDPAAGDVDIVNWKFCFNDGAPMTGWDQADDWADTLPGSPHWADAASRLTFPATTTGGWPTVDFRDWIPLDKYITAVIVYGQPITATTTAGMIVWRGYTLMGVPLNPWEDTNAYQTFADAYIPPCPYTLPLDPGDQDAVLYDDFHTNCSGVPADSNCGKYENWWRVSKYYPQIDGYRRFTEPGVYYGDGGVEPFSPGLGYWLIQDHCSEVRIDVYGTMVDTTSSYPIGLARNNSASYSCYNIVANPFYDPSESRHMPVFWRDAEVWKFEDVAPTDGEAGTLSVTAAAAAGWIEGAAQAYRDGSYRPLDPFEGTERDTLYEWEGFWVKTGNADAEDVGDSLVLLMNARPGGARRARPSPEQELLSFWKVRFGADCEELLQKDQNNFLGYKEYNTDVAVRCFGVYEMPDYTYPEPWLRVYFTDDSGEELQELYEDERQSITVWNAVLDCRSVKGEKVRVNWNAGDIPEGFELHLKDPDHDEWIDMLAQSEYYFISTGKKHNVEIIAEAPLEWVTKEVAETPQIPEEFYLADPTPNPFNASCRVEFGLANGDGGHINISVYNINGRKVNTLVDADLDPGFYHFTWDGNDAVGNRASSGMYLVRFTGAGRDITHKVSLIK